MAMSRIVFGDDSSAGAERAWGWMNAQSWGGVPVDIVTAAPPPSIAEAGVGVIAHEWTPIAPRHPLPEAGLHPLRFLTATADPRLLLVREAADGLLVVGARGLGGLEEMIVGSTTDWLMRSPPGPMVIVKDASPVRTALVCVDGSHHADAAVAAMAAMPWVPSVDCTVLGVADSVDGPVAACEAAGARLRDAGARVTVRVVDLDDMVMTLNPASRIAEAVREMSPDLVVMGTQGRTGLARLWFGSVAGAVVHRTNANVLLARS